MTDRALNISIGCAVSVMLWAATVGLMVVGVALNDAWLGRFALACSAAAATATIRCYFVRTNRLLRLLMADHVDGPRRLR